MSDTVQKPDIDKPAAENTADPASPNTNGSVEPPLINMSKGMHCVQC